MRWCALLPTAWCSTPSVCAKESFLQGKDALYRHFLLFTPPPPLFSARIVSRHNCYFSTLLLLSPKLQYPFIYLGFISLASDFRSPCQPFLPLPLLSSCFSSLSLSCITKSRKKKKKKKSAPLMNLQLKWRKEPQAEGQKHWLFSRESCLHTTLECWVFCVSFSR